MLTTALPDDDIANLARKLSAEQPIGAILLIATIPTAAALHNVMKDAGTKVTILLRGRRLEDIVPLDIVPCIILLPVEGKSVSLARCLPYYSTRGEVVRFDYDSYSRGVDRDVEKSCTLVRYASCTSVLYCINKVVLR